MEMAKIDSGQINLQWRVVIILTYQNEICSHKIWTIKFHIITMFYSILDQVSKFALFVFPYMGENQRIWKNNHVYIMYQKSFKFKKIYLLYFLNTILLFCFVFLLFGTPAPRGMASQHLRTFERC